jgi:Ribosomal protein S19
MPRSLKKGPFIAYHLLKKIDKMNAEGKKIQLLLGLVVQRFYQV